MNLNPSKDPLFGAIHSLGLAAGKLLNSAQKERCDTVNGCSIGVNSTADSVQRPKEPPREKVGPLALSMAAQAWGAAGTSRMEMQPELAFEFARILERETSVPRLGCATTRELLDELRARSDLDYRTWQP